MDAHYFVAVIGGACAGSELADSLAQAGVEVVVFDQNPLPYGKIEDGLPRWHDRMQAKECQNIDAKLNRPGVHFVPQCRLGRDVSPAQLLDEWGFHCVVLATGAWRDRPLAVTGAEAVTDGSLVYQNPFVYWFNHMDDRNYAGPEYQVPSGAGVIGGGLASLDVIKICQFQVLRQELSARGLSFDLHELEHKGVHQVLEHHGLSWEGLGLRPAKLFYRKRVADMPLVPLGDDPTPDKLEKAEKVREKLIHNASLKYAIEVHDLHEPVEVHSAAGRLQAVTFAQIAYENGKYRRTEARVRYELPLVVSSIGSLPEPMPGIPMEGELYHWADRFTGQLADNDRIYCVGNAITGRGNIRESSANARRLGQVFQAAVSGSDVKYAELFRQQEEQARVYVDGVDRAAASMAKGSAAGLSQLRARVRAAQAERGFHDYASWCQNQLSQR